MRLLHAQSQMEDDRKLCEYSLPEGTGISALFEPAVEINIEVSSRHQLLKFKVSNAMSVMALKTQIAGVIRCGMAPERMELRLGDVPLEDVMPLHFYGIKEDSKLNAMKPYIDVTVKSNKGEIICWRLNRKDAIQDVKVKLATSKITFCIKEHSSVKFQGEVDGLMDRLGGSMNLEPMRLCVITEDQNFNEVDDDDATVENYKIKDGDKLFLLIYKWKSEECEIMVTKTGRKLQGVEKDDTILAV